MWSCGEVSDLAPLAALSRLQSADIISGCLRPRSGCAALPGCNGNFNKMIYCLGAPAQPANCSPVVTAGQRLCLSLVVRSALLFNSIRGCLLLSLLLLHARPRPAPPFQLPFNATRYPALDSLHSAEAPKACSLLAETHDALTPRVP
jgi:hypothetical protein